MQAKRFRFKPYKQKAVIETDFQFAKAPETGDEGPTMHPAAKAHNNFFDILEQV